MSRCYACSQENCDYRRNCDCFCHNHERTQKTKPLRQIDRVRDLMKDGVGRSLRLIALELNDIPEASVSARLRDLRQAKYGGFTVERKKLAGHAWFTYRMIPTTTTTTKAR